MDDSEIRGIVTKRWQELKRRFEEEKRTLESELVRMHDGLRAERARRIENETLAAQLRQDVERLQEAYRHAISINHHGAEEIKEQADKMRDIQRLNSSLTILLSEIQPRLTVLEQDLFSNRLSPRDTHPTSTASASLADLPASTVPASNVHSPSLSPSLISTSRASSRNQVSSPPPAHRQHTCTHAHTHSLSFYFSCRVAESRSVSKCLEMSRSVPFLSRFDQT